jgi:hypothetical protein
MKVMELLKERELSRMLVMIPPVRMMPPVGKLKYLRYNFSGCVCIVIKINISTFGYHFSIQNLQISMPMYVTPIFLSM